MPISDDAPASSASLVALIAGNETPADVAAILSWFHDDPRRLFATDPDAIRGSGAADNELGSDRLIPVVTLGGQQAQASAATKTSDAAPHRNWSRFIDQNVRQHRLGRAGDDEEDDGDPRNDRPDRHGEDPTIAKSLSLFTRLFHILTEDGGSARNVLIAFDLTQYAAQARGWLERLITALLNAGVPLEACR